jgi:HD-GYP domain-containing protein (c-di-GMP phosphodiesterase class II)
MTIAKEEIQRCLFQTVGVLADTIGLREAYAAGHQNRVQQIARTLGQLMGLDEDTVDGLRMAATVHDFGNVLIPIELLNKPGPLNEEEWGFIRQHPTYGHEILKGIEFPWPVAEIVLQHHEHIDGTGYPQGLRGDNILLEARILCVANVMDAITNERPWRAALPVADALDWIQKHSGTRYDPTTVEVCLDLYTKQKHRLDPGYYGRD